MKVRPRFIGAWCQVKRSMSNVLGERFERGEWLWCSGRGMFNAPDGRAIKIQGSDTCFAPSTYQDRLTPPPGVVVDESWSREFWSMRPADRKIRMLEKEFGLIASEVARGKFETADALQERYRLVLCALGWYRADELKEVEEES